MLGDVCWVLRQRAGRDGQAGVGADALHGAVHHEVQPEEEAPQEEERGERGELGGAGEGAPAQEESAAAGH